MVASACLTMAAIHLLVWCQRRAVWANLLFSLASTAIAVYAILELRILRAETPAEFATALRWIHVPTWVLTLSLVGFVRLQLRAGRLWLAWTFCALRTLALLLNFLIGQNLNYREVTGLRHIPFLSESASLAEGVPNPWMLVGQLSLLLLVIFTVDAGLAVWRRGDRRQALVTGGSIVFFTVVSIFQSVLVFWRLVDLPLTASFFFLGIVAAMGYELSHDTLRAAQLSDGLRESEERMTLAVEAAQFGIWGRSLARNEMWGSVKWLHLFGFAAGERINFEQFIQRIHPDDREMVKGVVKRAQDERGDYAVDYRLILPDGTERWIASRGRVAPNANGNPDQMLGASVDITARKQSELELGRQRNELAHLSRVATVTELSGSLAHELNQPLAIILTNAQAAQRLLAQQPPDLAEARDILADIVSEDQRAGEVIRRLRSMLKHGETDLQPLNANEIVEEVLQFTRNDLIRHGVTSHRNLAEKLPPVAGDRIQLQQVLINLILNACDAMATTQPAGRKLFLSTSLQDGSLRISVSDNGCGLPPNAEQIFQPFYTTKKQGLGLGLSICRSIARAHQGRLWAEARDSVTGGTTLHLELPAPGEATP
jgi:two-component system sensor kinase FixL